MNKSVSKILFSLLILYTSYTINLVAMKETSKVDKFMQVMQRLHLIRIAQNKNELYPIIRYSQPADKKVNSGFFSPYGWLMFVPLDKNDVVIPVHEFFEEISLGEVNIDKIERLNISNLEPGVTFIESYKKVGSYFETKEYMDHFEIEVSDEAPTQKEMRETLKYLFTKYAEKFKKLEEAFQNHFKQFLENKKK